MVDIIKLHRVGFISTSNQSKRQGSELQCFVERLQTIMNTLLEKWRRGATVVFGVQEATQKLNSSIASRWV